MCQTARAMSRLSQWRAKSENVDKMTRTYSINELIDSNGTEVASEYIGPNKGIDAIERQTITYHHPSAADSDDEEFWGPS